MNSDDIPRIGIVAGTSPASLLSAQCVYSLLTRIGHWVDVIEDDSLEGPYDLLVFTSPQAQAALIATTQKPLIIYDADRYAGPAASNRRTLRLVLGGQKLSSAFTEAVMATDTVLTCDDHGRCIAIRTEDRRIWSLPFFLTPEIQDNRVFWRCAEILAMHVGVALERREFTYVEPWPAGYSAAFNLTLDLDDLGRRDPAFESVLDTAYPSTLFACADQLDAVPASTDTLEVACHGDVHIPFDNNDTNEARIETMWSRFGAAGRHPNGFSPPYLAYSSPRASLAARFSYLRIGYMEKELLFFPRLSGGVVVSGVSFYPDHALKYVPGSLFHSMIDRYLSWSRSRGFLATLCFHPALFPDAYRPYLQRQDIGVWRATMADIASWWRLRERTLFGLHSGAGAGVAVDRRLVFTRQEPSARIRTLTSDDRDAAPTENGQSPELRRSTFGTTVVCNATSRLAQHTELSTGDVFQRPPRRRFRQRGTMSVAVNTKNGFHGCFYGRLGFEAQVNGDVLRLPFLAANEYLVVGSGPRLGAAAHRAYSRARTMFRHVLSRITREPRPVQ